MRLACGVPVRRYMPVEGDEEEGLDLAAIDADCEQVADDVIASIERAMEKHSWKVDKAKEVRHM